MIAVEIVYIAADKSLLQVKINLQAGATVADALERSNILIHCPEIKGFALGIFSKKVNLNTVLKAGDRLEIYRPLGCDPKERRRQRAKTAK